MRSGSSAQRCDRARQWISLEIDSELSAFEGALLAHHLRRCGDCVSFRIGASRFSHDLRGAQLEALSRPVALPARGRARLPALQTIAAAAAAVAALGLGTTFGVLHAGQHGSLGEGARAAYFDSVDYEQTLIRKQVLRSSQFGRAV